MNWIVLLALTGAPLLLGSASPPTTPAQRDAQQAARHDDLHSEPRAVATEAGMVRFDGVYQAAYADYFFYLRLYPDGTAITVSTREPPEALNDWFNRNCLGLPRGTYTIQSDRIEFTAQAKRGSVEYAGKLGRDRIDFHTRSLMNGFEADQAYRFVPIASLSEEISDDAPDSCRS